MDLGRGVRVDAVCPSLVRTEKTEDITTRETRRWIPFGAPRDGIRHCLFASDNTSFMTCANVAIDGAVSASNGLPPL